MKVGFIVVCVSLCALSAGAATKCVRQYNVADLVCSVVDSMSLMPMYGTEWVVKCTINGAEVFFSGVSVMSKDNRPIGTVQANPVRDDVGELQYDKYCWCKMEKPAMSQWVSVNTGYGNYIGNGRCARACMAVFAEVVDFRAAMLGSVGQ